MSECWINLTVSAPTSTERWYQERWLWVDSSEIYFGWFYLRHWQSWWSDFESIRKELGNRNGSCCGTLGRVNNWTLSICRPEYRTLYITGGSRPNAASVLCVGTRYLQANFVSPDNTSVHSHYYTRDHFCLWPDTGRACQSLNVETFGRQYNNTTFRRGIWTPVGWYLEISTLSDFLWECDLPRLATRSHQVNAILWLPRALWVLSKLARQPHLTITHALMPSFLLFIRIWTLSGEGVRRRIGF